jgi:hypothetical protein
MMVTSSCRIVFALLSKNLSSIIKNEYKSLPSADGEIEWGVHWIFKILMNIPLSPPFFRHWHPFGEGGLSIT